MTSSKRTIRFAAASLLAFLAAGPLAIPTASAAAQDSMPRFTLRVSPGNFGEYAVHAVRLGMSQDQVALLIGAPSGTTVPHRGGVQLDYGYVDTWGHDSVFSVVIDEGVVVAKASARRRY